MKLYTRDEVKCMLESMGTHTEESVEYFLDEMTPIEQPTWNDVRNKMKPFSNLVALVGNMVENGLLTHFDIEIRDMLNSEITECKKVIEQIKH